MLIIHILQQSTKLICNSAWITWLSIQRHVVYNCRRQILCYGSGRSAYWKGCWGFAAADEYTAPLTLKTHLVETAAQPLLSRFLKNTALRCASCCQQGHAGSETLLQLTYIVYV